MTHLTLGYYAGSLNKKYWHNPSEQTEHHTIPHMCPVYHALAYHHGIVFLTKSYQAIVYNVIFHQAKGYHAMV